MSGSAIDRYGGLKVGAVIESINISRELIIMKELLLTNDDDDAVLRFVVSHPQGASQPRKTPIGLVPIHYLEKKPFHDYALWTQDDVNQKIL